MVKKADITKYPMDYLPIHFHTVGEKRNYNLVNFDLYAVGTIEYEPAENRFHARIGFENKDETEHVFFNSYHQDFNDAERAVNFVKEGKANGKLYNIYAETIDIHTSPSFPGSIIEVLALIYSFTH